MPIFGGAGRKTTRSKPSAKPAETPKPKARLIKKGAIKPATPKSKPAKKSSFSWTQAVRDKINKRK